MGQSSLIMFAQKNPCFWRTPDTHTRSRALTTSPTCSPAYAHRHHPQRLILLSQHQQSQTRTMIRRTRSPMLRSKVLSLSRLNIDSSPREKVPLASVMIGHSRNYPKPPTEAYSLQKRLSVTEIACLHQKAQSSRTSNHTFTGI